MAININSFRDFVLFIANKSGKGIQPSPSEFNTAVNRAVSEWTIKRYGTVKEYQPGRPIPRIAYEKTQAVMDDLRHLKEFRTFICDSEGKIGIPNGVSVADINNQIAPEYLHLTSMRGHYYKVSTQKPEKVAIRILSDDELDKVLESEINYPSFKFPVAGIFNTYFQVFPENFQYIDITYLRQPRVAVWAYTIQNGRPLYDAANSVDIDAPKESLNEIAMYVCSYLGINIREGDLTQYAEGKAATGI